ncbi:hypothetical protein [Tabrizicola soli]|uniref:Uncharacterized protein n=1 Tax=Tabrizicola soli TaxID=2185115 RepID=A0ABV7DXL4_9RHOB|nr:hypothetical protein [Tabrizicola soli]
MSIHAHFDKADRIERLDEAPIVLRFEPMFPRDLKRREMHGNRRGGDLTHIRAHLSHLNWQEIGGPDWIDRLNARIAQAAQENLQEEIDARTRKGRHKEAREVSRRGLVDPWKYTRLGPLREGVLTVNKRWLGGTGLEEWDLRRVFDFLDSAMDFLTENFPGDQLLEVHADVDEEAFHLHFVAGVWVEKVSENRGRQRLLQPSANPLIARYEHAQDVAGEAFLALGIHRGERRAEAVRQALAAGLEVPEPRRHIPPSEWRREQRRLALEDRDRIREAARAEAAATVADGVALAKSAVKKSRKRSIAEAKARKAETDREVAAAERDRARAEAQAEVARRASLEAEAARKEADRQAEAAREEAARVAQAAQDRAGVIVADATALATVTVRKSRKRAIAEARARRAEADRAVAAAERARADAEASAAVAHAAREAADDARREADRQAEAARAQSVRIIGSANDRAGVILSDAKLLGTKALKKARKRAARETQAQHDEVRRMKAKTAIELRRGQLAAAFVRGRTFRLQERANSLSRDIETKAKIWAERERQHREAELRLARIEQERTAAEAAIPQAQDAAAGILATAEARVEEARQALAKADADRIEAEGLVSAAREKASRITEAAEDRAGVIVADATALATVTVRKSRKRAIAEARTRRAETDRAAAVAEREREAAETRAEQARQAQARAEAEREAAEEAAVAARAEAARIQQAAEAAADRIRTEAVAAAEAEQARADAARRARDEAEAARLAADQAAAEATRKAAVERTEAARALDRAKVVTVGLAALTEEIAAGTLRLREDGRVTARAPDLLRPAYPEIAPAVRAAATVAERTRAARREAEDVSRAMDDAQKKAMDEIARARVVAKSEIDRERDAARTEVETERQAMTTELQTKRGEVEQQSAELERRLTRVGWLLNMLERLWPKFVRWLSHPDLPAAIKEEGIGIAAAAVSVLGALRQDDPDP